MKTITTLTITLGLLLCSSAGFAQVGINTTTPNAQLEVKSSNQAAPSNTDGMLIPKIDTFPAVNPTAAQQGMLVFLTTDVGGKTKGFYYWDNASTSWTGVGGKSGWELNGNTGTTPVTDFIGTADNQDLAFKTNNTERIRISANGLTGIGTANPKNKLHVVGTPTGLAPNPFSTAVFENAPYSYVNINSNSETGVIFGTGTDATSGALVYNNPLFPNCLTFRTNGNITRMNLADNGYLALGAFMPQYPLHFPSSNGDKISLWGGAGAHTGFGIQNNLFQIYSGNVSDDFVFGYGQSSAFTETMRIKNTGKVGIGTATPTVPLEFKSDLGDKISLYNSGPTTYGFGVQNSLLQIHSSYSGSDIAFGWGTSAALNETMRIKGNGNVGIGTQSPSSKLHIYNGASGMTPNPSAPAVVEGTGFTYVNVLSNSETGILFGSAGFHTNGGVVYNSGIYTNGMNFRTGGNMNRMNISSAGNVSIGDVLADARLHIVASNQATPANNDGIIIPRVNAFPAVSPTSAQNGMMVFLTMTAGGKLPGFYYWEQASASWKGVGTGANWSMTGNSGTSSGTNFIGTTDNNDLAFRRNNIRAGQLGATATAFGTSALANNTAAYTTAFGVNSLYNNTTGEWNVGVGINSLKDNTIGHHNTALGDGAMSANQNGEQNTAVGHNALGLNESGTHSVAVGMNSLYNNTAGISNTVLGTGAMYWHASGNNNTALGMEAMNNQTSGSNNIAIGKGANVPSLTGSDQLSIGNVIYGTGMNSAASVKIGIGDSAPDAKMEIAASNSATPANTDGILIPRVNAFPISNPTAAQNGMMVYLSVTIGSYAAGFYYWDNAAVSWFPVGARTGWSATGNSGTSPSNNYIGTNDNAALAVRTNGSERIRVTATGDVGIKTTNPTTDFEVNGYTKLGSSAPAIKMVKLTGVTASAVGSSVSVAHGVTTSKIISISVLVEHLANSYMSPGFTASSGYEFNYYVNGGNIFIVNKSGNSANILSKPIKIVVTYEE